MAVKVVGPPLIGQITLPNNTTYALKDTSIYAGTGISIFTDDSKEENRRSINNTGVLSVASGTANGTISVNTGGAIADVAVTGLGTAAYADDGDYLPIEGGIVTGELSAHGIKTYASSYPSYVFKNGADDTYSDLCSMNWDVTNKQWFVNCWIDVNANAAEQYLLPRITYNDTNWHAYDILTSKNAVTVAQGGTGATNATAARTNLGLGTMATQSSDSYLAKTGGTMTGAITLAADPIDDLHAATKQYVDNASIEIIVSTNTSSARALNGHSNAANLRDGMMVLYKTIYDVPTGNMSLNLRFADDITTSGAIPIYLDGTSRLQGGMKANSFLFLTYDATTSYWYVVNPFSLCN